jgi:hypothetical protein
MGMPFGAGLDAPIRPVGHHKAVSAIAGILLIFTASILVIVGLALIINDGWTVEENWEGWDYSETRVIHWNYLLGGAFEFAAFSMGLVAGILAIRTRRWTLTFMGAVLVTVGSSFGLIDQLDVGYFLFVLSLLALAMVYHARPAYRTADGRPPSQGPGDRAEAYGFG